MVHWMVRHSLTYRKVLWGPWGNAAPSIASAYRAPLVDTCRHWAHFTSHSIDSTFDHTYHTCQTLFIRVSHSYVHICYILPPYLFVSTSSSVCVLIHQRSECSTPPLSFLSGGSSSANSSFTSTYSCHSFVLLPLLFTFSSRTTWQVFSSSRNVYPSAHFNLHGNHTVILLTLGL